ncbi:hypothetical protein HIM_00987 [Hirsutella minnesotensis 3608]|nr:hypothetical protein HIM_00987 [Hirsutella minnesotensis 3608]
MSKQKVIVTAALGTTAIGAAMFTNRGGRKDTAEPQRHSAHAKRDHGLGGAGVEGNAMTGNAELSATPTQSERNQERKTGTTAPKEKLPSGGVSGGEGAGGSTARKTQLPMVGGNSSAEKSGAGVDRDGKNTTEA